jgi:hypothetical protein
MPSHGRHRSPPEGSSHDIECALRCHLSDNIPSPALVIPDLTVLCASYALEGDIGHHRCEYIGRDKLMRGCPDCCKKGLPKSVA